MAAAHSLFLQAGTAPLERIQQTLAVWYERILADVWGSLYWGMIWVCGFVITFLLVRMLFTRWGDQNITQKTLSVSLLVHLLLGMISNNVVFGPGGGTAEEQPGVPIRRVVFEDPVLAGGAAAGNSADPFDASAKRPGQAPAWEQANRSDTRRPTRQSPGRLETPSMEITPAARAASDEALPVPYEKLADPSSASDPSPVALRDTAKIPQSAGAASQRIGEETAQSRADGTGSGGGTRLRTPGADPDQREADFARRDREVPTTDIPVPTVPQPAGSPGESLADGQTPPARQTGPREASRMTGSAKPSPVEATPEAPVGTERLTVPSGRPFRRTAPGAGQVASRDLAGANPGGPAGLPGGEGPGDRAGEPAGAEGGDRPGLLPSGPDLSAGDSQVGLISPDLMRSGNAGAIDKNTTRVPAPYRLRTSPQRSKIAFDMGANEESERAVEASLNWLAAHQQARGYWSPIEATLGREPEKLNFGDGGGGVREQQLERERSGLQSESGLTALAVLAFLGKGYTHEENVFADHVDRALRWLVSQQDAQGYLGGKANRYARMYCHGMATIALGEAYGLTRDRSLREPLARAVQYILAQQYPDGSWRYSDWRQLESRHRKGDMSMFGWQLMALKSARTAGLDIPDSAFQKCTDFLIASGNDLKTRGLSASGGLAGYRVGEAPKPAMTAESLFCKQMLGIKRTNRAAVEATDYLLAHLPQHSKQDLYYWYYGTLAMYQQGGEPWQKWNEALRDNLVADQRTDGDFAGSWNPRFPWGDYGGRVFSTAMSALCLEVYYRFLPLYRTDE